MFPFSDILVKEQIKIILVDDHAMFRQGVAGLLEADSRIKVVGEAANGKELLVMLNRLNPDVVLLDVQMPVMNGIQVLEALGDRFPDLKIIMVSMEFNTFLLEEYIKKGIHGFIPKGCDIAILVNAINEVHDKGNCYELSQKLIDKHNKHNAGFMRSTSVLTAREMEVLSLTCKGKANKQIAQALHIAERTVEFHKTNIYSKTGLSNQADLISYGIKNGLDII